MSPLGDVPPEPNITVVLTGQFGNANKYASAPQTLRGCSVGSPAGDLVSWDKLKRNLQNSDKLFNTEPDSLTVAAQRDLWQSQIKRDETIGASFPT
jgi:hypothetical protein